MLRFLLFIAVVCSFFGCAAAQKPPDAEKLFAQFERAQELMSKGQFDEAARIYLELAAAMPGRPDLAAKALNNAAVCFESLQRFAEARKLYERLFTEHRGPLADAALFRAARNAELSYDFEGAIELYRRLAKDAPSAKDRPAALLNAARLLEGLQRNAEAAPAYLLFVEAYPDDADAPKLQLRVAQIYAREGEAGLELAALRGFVQKFANRAAEAELLAAQERIRALTR